MIQGIRKIPKAEAKAANKSQNCLTERWNINWTELWLDWLLGDRTVCSCFKHTIYQWENHSQQGAWRKEKTWLGNFRLPWDPLPVRTLSFLSCFNKLQHFRCDWDESTAWLSYVRAWEWKLYLLVRERRYNLIVEGKFLKAELQEVVALKSATTVWRNQWYILAV